MPIFRQIQLPDYHCHHLGIAPGNLNHNLNHRVDHVNGLLITLASQGRPSRPFPSTSAYLELARFTFIRCPLIFIFAIRHVIFHFLLSVCSVYSS